MKNSICLFLLFVSTALVCSEIPESTWKSLVNRNVILIQNDGSTIEGELALVEAKAISVITFNGEVITIDKSKFRSAKVKVISVQGYNNQNSQITESPEYDTRPVSYQYYGELEELRGETIPTKLTGRKHLYIIKVNLGFNKDDKNILNDIITRKNQIIDKLLTWFSNQEANDLADIANRDVIREEVRTVVNQIVAKPVLDIRFTKFEILGE